MYDNFYSKGITASLYQQAYQNQSLINNYENVNNPVFNNTLFYNSYNKQCSTFNNNKGECLKNKFCGYCIQLNQCVPGLVNRPSVWGSCPLPNNYIYDDNQKVNVFKIDTPNQF